MLLTDGHKSHLTLEVVDLCIKNEVILFCLPPHTTHALQPLDVAVPQGFLILIMQCRKQFLTLHRPSATGTVASNPLVECGLISPD